MSKCKLCKSQEFDNNHQDLDDLDIDKLSEQVKEGFSSGHLVDGKGKNIYWELKVNVWKD